MKVFWRIFFAVLIFIVVLFTCASCCMVGFLAMAVASRSGPRVHQTFIKRGTTGDKKIAVVDVNGMILDGGQAFQTDAIASPENIISQLKTAKDDPTVKVIVLKENTPGGTVIGSQKICDVLGDVRNKKPVVTYIESMGASGGYYIANCTDYIIANRDGITGSIGVLIENMDFTGLFEKLGIKEKILTNTQGTLKSGQDFFTPGSETEKIFKTLLDENFNDFIDVVVQGRKNSGANLSKEEILKLADGRIYSGRQAAKNKLVDMQGNFDDMVKYIQDKYSIPSTSSIVEYSSTSFFDSVFSENIKKLIPGFQTDAAASQLAASLKPGVYAMYMFKN